MVHFDDVIPCGTKKAAYINNEPEGKAIQDTCLAAVRRMAQGEFRKLSGKASAVVVLFDI